MDIAAITAFLVEEGRLIDERRFGDWLALYTDETSYWLPIKPDQQSPHDHISLVYDDRMLLELRVQRLQHPDMHSQTPPSRTFHMIGNVGAEAGADGTVIARSKQIVGEYRGNRQRVHLASVVHVLVPQGASYRIKSKRVDLLNCDADHDGIVILF